MLGDQTHPLLAIIDVPVKQELSVEQSTYVEQHIKDEIYFPLIQNHIKNIEFFLYNHDNTPITFFDDDATVYVSLAFKRVK